MKLYGYNFRAILHVYDVLGTERALILFLFFCTMCIRDLDLHDDIVYKPEGCVGRLRRVSEIILYFHYIFSPQRY
jgi:hypothetical protein